MRVPVLSRADGEMKALAGRHYGSAVTVSPTDPVCMEFGYPAQGNGRESGRAPTGLRKGTESFESARILNAGNDRLESVSGT